jgi:hypothetical protein
MPQSLREGDQREIRSHTATTSLGPEARRNYSKSEDMLSFAASQLRIGGDKNKARNLQTVGSYNILQVRGISKYNQRSGLKIVIAFQD